MSKRSTVCDYAGNELYKGDMVVWSARQGNTVRMADGIIRKVTARAVDGRLRPMVLVEPTGFESGFVKRRSLRAEWVEVNHVRLIPPLG